MRDHDGQPMSRIEAGHLIHDELFKTTSGLMTASSKAIQPATCVDNCGLRSGILLLDKQHHFRQGGSQNPANILDKKVRAGESLR